ncbi:hypothetical protein DFP72DRAFT_917671 [Ephemerocybe angulata]|uniref:Protein kinase domain-containing protein n=1 Tax=Ephemerocybe angulata TaxID=980116 RepID=A0A8H6LZ05_9AGAR|nr:hypothetical protein DFP72DRAFT_917671 [Tulosesus angulatus]
MSSRDKYPSFPPPGQKLTIEEICVFLGTHLHRLAGTERAEAIGPATTLSPEFQCRYFDSPGAMSFTKDFLEYEVEVDTKMYRLTYFLEAPPAGSGRQGEDIATGNLVEPVVNFWLHAFTASVPEVRAQRWYAHAKARTNQDSLNEVAIVITKGKGTYFENKACIELKNPRSSDSSSMRALDLSGGGPLPIMTKKVLKQAAKYGFDLSAVRTARNTAPPWSFPMAISTIPFIFCHAFLFGREDNPLVSTLAYTKNAVTNSAPREDKDASVAHATPEDYQHFATAIGFWVFSVLIHSEATLRTFWGDKFPEMVSNANLLTVSASKAIHTSPLEVTLIRLWVIGLSIRLFANYLIIWPLLKLNKLPILRRLKQSCDTALNVQPSWFPSLPIGVSLPFPRAILHQNGSTVYVYAAPAIVVKVFRNPISYTRESVCYDTLRSLQGAGIPVVYGSGVRSPDQRHFLILSYEGKQLETVSESDKSALQQLVDCIHQDRIHHHDLHARNVVRNARGKLSIIDFGLAEPCSDDQCTDRWKEDFEG